MARSFVYIVSESPEVVEKVKKSCEGQDVSFFNYTGPQWREGLDNQFFRTQLVNGVPSLAAGFNTPLSETPLMGSNVVSFPQPTPVAADKVQKMEDLEAKAIEAAIYQYKGNLT
ncbi:MAG: hypothetical protein ACK41T_02380, partial [Pseudobdellovibrio sp.]